MNTSMCKACITIALVALAPVMARASPDSTTCATDAATPTPAHSIRIGTERFAVELALDDASRMRGLMYRDCLGARQGMLFVFEQEQPLSFWMRNTRVPLDIIYFDARGQLVSVQEAPPCRTAECPTFPSGGPGQFVVELQRGSAKALGLERGAALCAIDPLPGGRVPVCNGH